MTWKTMGYVAAAVVLVTVTAVSTVQEYQTNRRLRQSRALADSLATRATDLAGLLDQRLRSDERLRGERDAALAEARRLRARGRHVVAGLPPLPDSIPDECARVLERHDGVVLALLDETEANDSLERVIATDSVRIDSLRTTVTQAADSLMAMGAELHRLRNRIPEKLPGSARLALLAEVRAPTGAPATASVGLETDLGLGVKAFALGQQDATGDRRLVVGARKAIRLW